VLRWERIVLRNRVHAETSEGLTGAALNLGQRLQVLNAGETNSQHQHIVATRHC